MKRLLISTLFCLSFVSQTSAAEQTAVFTYAGVFESCSDAVAYRNSILISDYDLISKDYDKRLTHVNAVLNKLRRNLSDVENQYQSASSNQKKAIAISLARYVGLKVLSNIATEGVPDEIRKTLTQQEEVLLDFALSKSTEMNVSALDAALQNRQAPTLNLTTVQLELLVEILTKLSPAGKVIAEFAGAVEAVLVPYFDWDLIKSEFESEALVLSQAISKIEANTPSRKIAHINQVKNQIDTSCSTANRSISSLASVMNSEVENNPEKSPENKTSEETEGQKNKEEEFDIFKAIGLPSDPLEILNEEENLENCNTHQCQIENLNDFEESLNKSTTDIYKPELETEDQRKDRARPDWVECIRQGGSDC